MSSETISITELPLALHCGEGEVPFVPYQKDVEFQLLHVNVENALWVVRVRFQPGVTIARHRHTGEVLAFTLAGSWRYLEYPDVNTAGSYLYEPAGAIHTLHVPDTNDDVTDVWFAVRGANLDLDDDENIIAVLDAGAVRDMYLTQCAEKGLPNPPVLGL